MFNSLVHMHGNCVVERAITNAHQKDRSNIQEWDEPVCVTHFDVNARDYGSGIKSHEFNDTPATLQQKVHVLAQLIRQAKYPLAYTGAGISTAAGIDDYASKAKKKSVTAAGRAVIKDWKLARPTLTHRVLAAMYHNGHLAHWIQQNHDSLPQKAGYPQHALNEIHGSLHDPANPIVPYEGHLRDDLYSWMHEWQEKQDLCLALGTSMSGFNCDSVPERCADRTNGLVIVNLQQTTYDGQARLRIYAKTDVVFRMLAKELNLMDGDLECFEQAENKENKGESDDDDVFRVPFDAEGYPSTTETQVWNLNVGERVKLTGGPYKNDVGEIVSKNQYGHYRLRFANSINPTFKVRRRTFSLWMGSWWIEMATHGRGIVPGGRLPFLNVLREKVEKVEENKEREAIGLDLGKYQNMLKIGLNVKVVEHKMKADRIDEKVVAAFVRSVG